MCNVHYNNMFIKIPECGKMHRISHFKMRPPIFTYKMKYMLSDWILLFLTYLHLTYYWNVPFYLWISQSYVIGLDFHMCKLNMILEIMSFLTCECHFLIFKMWKKDDATCKQMTFLCIDYICLHVIGLQH